MRSLRGNSTRRIAVVLECAAVFTGTLACVVLLARSPLGRWESGMAGKPFVEYLVMMGLPVVVMIAARRDLGIHGLWLRQTPRHLEAGLTAAVPFGLAHALGPFLAGLLFGYLRDKTGSILASAIVHGFPQGIAWAFMGR